MKNKEFFQSLADYAAQLRRTIEAEVDGFDPSPKAMAERRAKVLDPVHGYEYFVNTYFPHYVQHASKSQLHEYLFKRLPEIVASSNSENDAIAAPRGEAKSTLVTQLFSLWNIITAQKHVIVIVMDTTEQSYPMLEAIKAELEFNPRLMGDFPEAVGKGRLWQVGEIVTTNNIKVKVVGCGKKLRGIRHGPYRPDLTILDDIENDENVQSPEQRDKLDNWVKKAVMPLGGVGKKYDVIYIGTILHYDSVLSRVLKNPFWKRIKLKAVLQWPSNMDLWEQWEETYRNSSLEDAEAVADAFYQRHKAAMNEGAITSWAARSILDLMKIRARDGHDAFDSEYQNDPVAGDNAPFANAIQYWVHHADDWLFYGACDPSLGKSGKGRDPSALLVGGYSRRRGVLDVVEAKIQKRLPDKIISDVIALQREYQCLVWGVETVQFQEFLKDELVKRSAQLGIPVPARGIKPTADKTLRIESIQPHMSNGLIRLHATQSVLIDQLRHFPMADHDDGPDALHMLWMVATTGVASSNARPIVIPEPVLPFF